MSTMQSPSFSLDAMTLKMFGSMLQRLPREVQNEVRKSNRAFAAELRDLIRAEAPTTGPSASREGPKHDTRHGAVRRSIISRASNVAAYVQGGGKGAPHFIVHEFGGSVRWTNGRASHLIPVKRRPQSVKSPLGSGKHEAGSYFFLRTADRHIPRLQQQARDAAVRIIHEMLGRGRSSTRLAA